MYISLIISVEAPNNPVVQNAAVIRFADWLTTLTVQRENELGGGAGSAKVVLCGHRCVIFEIFVITRILIPNV